MSHVIAETALLDDGFARDVRIDIDDAGTIVAVTPASGPALEGVFKGVLLPGMTDLHSHAFQRSFAGRTGIAHPHDDFWSWREAMYRAAGAIQPDCMRAIAAYLAMRLLEGGYTSLVEFHYLFNQPDGSPYASRTVMADAVIEGAQSAGIGLTLLYGIYETGGVDGRPLEGGQRRFANTAADALTMLSDAAGRVNPSLNFGLAPHSLRAVPAASLRAIEHVSRDTPVHIHVAEQTAEVADCVRILGAPPVAWLLDHAPVGPNWCLIHATHAEAGELKRAARAGAVIGLCPSTEADLGDGIFAFDALNEAGGAFGIGSDSNVSTEPCDELRLLEYAQRLRRRRRNLGIGAGAVDKHTGVALWRAAAAGGAQASGRATGRIAPGYRADFCLLQSTLETTGHDPGSIVDAAIFGAGARSVSAVMAGGKWLVENGRHSQADAITAAYATALATLA